MTAPVCTALGVYPRVGGGTVTARSSSLGSRGLSPRRRGNLPYPACQDAPDRSIPA